MQECTNHNREECMKEERLNNLIKLCETMRKGNICIYMYDYVYNDIKSTIVTIKAKNILCFALTVFFILLILIDVI